MMESKAFTNLNSFGKASVFEGAAKLAPGKIKPVKLPSQKLSKLTSPLPCIAYLCMPMGSFKALHSIKSINNGSGS